MEFIKTELTVRQCGNGVLAVGAITVLNLVMRHAGVRLTLLFGLDYPEVLTLRTGAMQAALLTAVLGGAAFVVLGLYGRQKHAWAFVTAMALYIIDGFATLQYSPPLLWIIHMSWCGVMLRGAVGSTKLKDSVISA